MSDSRQPRRPGAHFRAWPDRSTEWTFFIDRLGQQVDARIVCAGETARLMISGELDLASAPRIERSVRLLINRRRVARLILDLRRLSFTDMSGVRLAVTLTALAERHAVAISLIPPPRHVRRAFKLAGVDDRLPYDEAEAQ